MKPSNFRRALADVALPLPALTILPNPTVQSSPRFSAVYSTHITGPVGVRVG